MHSLETLEQLNKTANKAARKQGQYKLVYDKERRIIVSVPLGKSPIAQLANGMEKARKERAEFDAKYPAHAKVKTVEHASHTVGLFIDWLKAHKRPAFLISHVGTERILAQYFDIDLQVFAEEKDTILKEFLQSQNERKANG